MKDVCEKEIAFMSMENDKDRKEEFAFITEKIKGKPINKRRLAIKIIGTIILAIIFGVVACFTFVGVEPLAKRVFHKEEEPKITIPKDEEDIVEEKVTDETGDQDISNASSKEKPVEKVEQEPEEVPQEEVPEEVPENTEIDDYKSLYGKLYEVVKEAEKALVTVTAVKSDVDWFNNTYENEDKTSGLVIANNGQELLILAERNVIADADQIEITFNNKETQSATLKKYDGNTGLAILAIPVSNMVDTTLEKITIASLGNSYSEIRGNIVMAVGSPMGYTNSISYGMITSTGNTTSIADATYGLITTDIVGSRSGSGFLLNTKGEVVGVIAQKYSIEDNESMITAIAISELKTVIEKLSNNYDISYVGIKGTTITESISAEIGIPEGVYVSEVELDSPAMGAGIQNGDIIINLNGNQIDTMKDYQNELIKLQPGQVVEIKVKRQGADEYTQISFSLALGIKK